MNQSAVVAIALCDASWAISSPAGVAQLPALPWQMRGDDR